MTMHQSSSHFSSNPSLQISPMSVSSPLSVTSIPSFDKDGLAPAHASLNWLQQIIGVLDTSLRLPNTPRAFAIYLAGLVIVFTGAFMHVLMAAQIMQAEFRLNQLQQEYRTIEQQNGDILFQIARDSNMARLKERVVAHGYVPVQEREYVFIPTKSLTGSGTAAEITSQANTGIRTDTSANNHTANSATSNHVTEPAVAVPSSINMATTNLEGGQFARWEEFWNMTWRSATGASVNASSAANSAQTANTTPSFWSAWWEQATENGAKLLDQFRGR
jgi:hypothetical protein